MLKNFDPLNQYFKSATAEKYCMVVRISTVATTGEGLDDQSNIESENEFKERLKNF